MSEIFTMQKDEHEVLKIRKHWFILLREGLSTLILTVLPFFAASTAAGLEFVPLSFFSSAPWIFLSSLWLLLCVMLLSTVWTNFILDIWLVSSHRIVRVEQIKLFNREVESLQLERVQDVIIETRGIFATLLNFGTIKVETAGAERSRFIFGGISNPEKVKTMILAQVQSRVDRGDTRRSAVLAHAL
jgi:hypothetical protein